MTTHIGSHKRYRELDALRGLAALSVVAFHYLSSFNVFADVGYTSENAPIVRTIKFSILHIFFEGKEAVLFFFVLSGFVLYLALDRLTIPSCKAFEVQRICRIYLPFMAAAGLGLLLNWLLHLPPVPELSDRNFNTLWARSPNFMDVVQHLSFIWRFDELVSDAPTWSLLHEMRFSLIFPLIVLFVDRTSAYFSLAVSIGISFAFTHLRDVTNGQYNIFTTLMYSNEFVVGALLARYRFVLVAAIQKSPRLAKASIFVIAVLAYSYTWWFFPDIAALHRIPFDNLLVTIGASLFILGSLSCAAVSRVLRSAPLQYFGRLSYSIYLYHIIVVILVLHFLYTPGGLIDWLLPFVVLGGTIICADVSRRFIEVPAMRAGKLLGSRFAS